MTADDLKAQYKDFCLQSVSIRRFTGPAASRTSTDYAAFGNAALYTAAELVGSVKQGDYKIIVIAGDLTTAGLTLPVTTSDRAVIDSRELGILAVSQRKAPDGTLIAYELAARG
jgi:hypothetical protein